MPFGSVGKVLKPLSRVAIPLRTASYAYAPINSHRCGSHIRIITGTPPREGVGCPDILVQAAMVGMEDRCFRRAIAPISPKPRIIIAQVAGSGTPGIDPMLICGKRTS